MKFLDNIQKVVDKVLRNNRDIEEEDFLTECGKELKITYPETFLDIYFRN